MVSQKNPDKVENALNTSSDLLDTVQNSKSNRKQAAKQHILQILSDIS